MKLVIFNGSPRQKKSNSKILIEHFLNGYNNICSESIPIHYLANRKQKEKEKDLFQKADTVLIIFPLYTDCMPGIVKEFFENVLELKNKTSKKMGFIVQSGFPEAVHSITVERYLKKFTERLNCEYLGTIIKGGVEGIQIMPPWMTKKLFKRFEYLGEYFAKNGKFSAEIKEKLSKPFRMSFVRRMVFAFLCKTGLNNFYWNKNLKRNNAYMKRFDKPFQ